MSSIYHQKTSKSLQSFVSDFTAVARKRDFLVHNEDKMDMAATFAGHGAEVPPGFNLYMIQVCKPHKAAKSLSKNPERAVLMPKSITAFEREGETEIRFLRYGKDFIEKLVLDDEFAASLAETYDAIAALIDEAAGA